MYSSRTPTASQHTPSPLPSPALANPSSFFATTHAYKLFTTSAHAQPDPDQEGAVWHEPEVYSAVISRKEHPRDATSLLSLREVLRQKANTDGSIGLPSSLSSSLNSSGSRVGAPPPSAWAKPAVQVTMQAAGGEVSGFPEAVESAGKILHEIESVTSEWSRSSSAISTSHASSSGFFDAHIRRGKASSIMSVESDVTIGPDNSSIHNLIPPAPPPKDGVEPTVQRNLDESPLSPTPTTSTFAHSLTSSLNHAVRYMLHTRDGSRSVSPVPKNHHGLLIADAMAIDDRPHIKYDWTIGKRLKFSCTAYYAKQFDALRRRCGIDDIFLKSLGRSSNWAAEGGKSRSNFWKTSDDRFIIKTLVNAWNVADLSVHICQGLQRSH